MYVGVALVSVMHLGGVGWGGSVNADVIIDVIATDSRGSVVRVVIVVLSRIPCNVKTI